MITSLYSDLDLLMLILFRRLMLANWAFLPQVTALRRVPLLPTAGCGGLGSGSNSSLFTVVVGNILPRSELYRDPQWRWLE